MRFLTFWPCLRRRCDWNPLGVWRGGWRSRTWGCVRSPSWWPPSLAAWNTPTLCKCRRCTASRTGFCPCTASSLDYCRTPCGATRAVPVLHNITVTSQSHLTRFTHVCEYLIWEWSSRSREPFLKCADSWWPPAWPLSPSHSSLPPFRAAGCPALLFWNTYKQTFQSSYKKNLTLSLLHSPGKWSLLIL